MTKVYQNDGVNLLIRTLFNEWPKENLAQIYTGIYYGVGEFCGHYFQIGPKERKLGWLFYSLKPVGFGVLSGQRLDNQNRKRSISVVRRWVADVVSTFIASGYWDEFFSVHSSTALENFIRDFKPEVIYTEGYSLSFTELALDIATRLKIPICYFPMDDWHSSLFAGSRVHRKVKEVASRLARDASLRFALGPKMTEVMTARYGVPFECLYHADSPQRFDLLSKINTSPKKELIIGYAGSLFLGRLTAFQDLLNACAILNRPFRIEVYSESLPPDVPIELVNAPQIKFLPLPDHENLPRTLANCDVLFLPESFDHKYKTAIELSLSTKAHLYMFCRRPILVYGPEWSGTVDYAKRFGWGVIVDKHDINMLSEGIKTVIGSQAEDLINKAYQIALLNHDINQLNAKALARFNAINRREDE
jgi:hypothetical protein